MQLKTRLFTGMISGAGTVIIKTLLNIALVPILIHKLGVEIYGLYILLIGISEMALLLDFGFTAALVKLMGSSFGADTTNKTQELLKIGQILYGLMALLAMAAGLLFIPIFPSLFHLPEALARITTVCVAIIALEGAVSLLSCYFRAILVAHSLHQWSNLGDTLFNILSNLVGLILLLLGFGLSALLMARLGAAILRLLLLFIWSLRAEPSTLLPQAPLNLATLKEVSHLSFHAFMINFSVFVSHKIDNFVIAAFLPLKMVGIFEIVFRFLGFILQITSRMSEVVFPMFSRFITVARHAEARQLFLRMSSFSHFTVCVLLMLVTVHYTDLFHIFSAGQIPIHLTLPVLMVAIPCIWSGTMQMPAGYYLFASGRQKYLTVSSLITAGCNLILSLILIHWFGILGVALGTLIPQLIQHQAGLIRETCKSLEIPLLEYIREVHLKTFPALLVIFLLLMTLHPWVQSSLHPLLMFCLVSAVISAVAAILWLSHLALPDEKAFLSAQIGAPLKKRFQRMPEVARG